MTNELRDRCLVDCARDLVTTRKDQILRYKDFESFLMDRFCNDNPDILDDNILDAFDTWVEFMDIFDCMFYAEKYAEAKVKEASL